MRLLLPLLLLPALHGIASADDCQKMFDRSKPILLEIVKTAGKTLTDAEIAKQVASCRQASKRDPVMDCVLAAADDAAVRVCWKTAFEDYRTASLAIEGKVRLHALERALKYAFTDKGAFVAGKVGPTPKTPCCSRPEQTCPPDPTEWKDPVWRALDFAPDTASRFRYSYDSDGKMVTATAIGDLACDGRPLALTLTARIDHGNVVTEIVSSADRAPGTAGAARPPSPPAAPDPDPTKAPSPPAAPLTVTRTACGPLRAGSKLTEAALRTAFPGATIRPIGAGDELTWLIKDAATGLVAGAAPEWLTIDQGNIDLFGVKLRDDGTKLAAPAFRSIDCNTDPDRPGYVACNLPWLTINLRNCNPPKADAIPPAKLKGCTISEVWWLPVGRRDP